MLVKRVDKVPPVLNLETGGEHQPNFLGQVFGEDAFCGRGIVAVEGDGG